MKFSFAYRLAALLIILLATQAAYSYPVQGKLGGLTFIILEY